MPNGNGIGPAGAGPMTGRGMGSCTGNRAMEGPQFGRGMQRGFRNNGKPRGYCGTQMQNNRIAALEQKISELSKNQNN